MRVRLTAAPPGRRGGDDASLSSLLDDRERRAARWRDVDSMDGFSDDATTTTSGSYVLDGRDVADLQRQTDVLDAGGGRRELAADRRPTAFDGREVAADQRQTAVVGPIDHVAADVTAGAGASERRPTDSASKTSTDFVAISQRTQTVPEMDETSTTCGRVDRLTSASPMTNLLQV